jgi:hypothetical protein
LQGPSPNSLRSCVRTQHSWVQMRTKSPRSGGGHRFHESERGPSPLGPEEDPRFLGPTSIPITLGSCIRIQFSWVSRPSPILFSQSSVPNSLRSCIQTKVSWIWTQTQFSWVMRHTHFYWILRPDPFLLGHVFGLKSLGSYVQTKISWIRCPNPTLLDLVSGSHRIGYIDRPDPIDLGLVA